VAAARADGRAEGEAGGSALQAIVRFVYRRVWYAGAVIDDDHALDDNFARRCEVCGATLSKDEILQARELGQPFVCGQHAAEALPAGDSLLEEDAGD
jgi:hypothetical protein